MRSLIASDEDEKAADRVAVDLCTHSRCSILDANQWEITADQSRKYKQCSNVVLISEPIEEQ